MRGSCTLLHCFGGREREHDLTLCNEDWLRFDVDVAVPPSPAVQPPALSASRRKAAENQMKKQQNEMAQSILEPWTIYSRCRRCRYYCTSLQAKPAKPVLLS